MYFLAAIYTMKLSVPTNWQPELLDKINKTRIIEIYGKLDEDPIGGGRPSFTLPAVNKRRAEYFVSRVHSYGLKFNYLLNAVCLGNIEWSASGQSRIRRFLDWLSAIEVDTVTVAVPYLLQLIKKSYPHFQTKVSVCAQVSGPIQARYWEELGADEIALASWLVNRNFDTLKNIRLAVKCRLQVLANSRCLNGCPFSFYHYASDSHSSRAVHKRHSMDYCKFTCFSLI